MPVQMVEGDVAITADGVPVMIHQETLEPDQSTGKLKLASRNEARAWVSNSTYHAIRDLDAGTWFDSSFSTQRIPKLTDVLNLSWRDKTLLLDLIDPRYWVDPADTSVVSQFRDSVVPLLRTATQAGASISVLAFNPCMLEMFHKELPAISRTLAIWTNHRGKEDWIIERACELKVTTLTIADFMLRDEPMWAELARRNGLQLGVFELTPDSHHEFRSWTPDQRKAIWDLVIEKRVDWFTSDFPEEFIHYRDAKR